MRRNVNKTVKNKYLKLARISEREFRSILELFCADVEALARKLVTESLKKAPGSIKEAQL
jgi:hypothetical protein